MTSLDFVARINNCVHFKNLFRLLITISLATLMILMTINPFIRRNTDQIIPDSNNGRDSVFNTNELVVEIDKVETKLVRNVTLKQQPNPQYRTIHASTFLQSFKEYPWNNLKLFMEEKNIIASLKLSETLIQKLIPYIIKEPLVPINLNDSCKEPPPLQSLDDSYNDQPCKRIETPRKVGVLLQLGFDVDTLEIHLNELHDLVDFFFILESTRSHYKAIKKPLIWELVKNQPRFQHFQDKIVHFILDDATLAHQISLQNTSDSSIWGVERLQEKLRWMKFLEWNKETEYFTDNDLLGFGDIDEVPNREAIHRLKNCELPGDPVDIGIWFPFGSIDQAFTPAFPVSKKYPLTLGDPTYWTLKTAKGHSTYASRMRGSSKAFILGGMHMTFYGYLPSQLMKRLTPTELDPKDVATLAYFFEGVQNSSPVFEIELKYGTTPKQIANKIHKIQDLKPAAEREEFMDKIMYLPWFYNCNRRRYPAWEKQHDTRLD